MRDTARPTVLTSIFSAVIALGLILVWALAVGSGRSGVSRQVIALEDWVGRAEASPAVAMQNSVIAQIGSHLEPTTRTGAREFKEACQDLALRIPNEPTDPPIPQIRATWHLLIKALVDVSTSCTRLVGARTQREARVNRDEVVHALRRLRTNVIIFQGEAWAVVEYSGTVFSDVRLLDDFGGG